MEARDGRLVLPLTAGLAAVSVPLSGAGPLLMRETALLGGPVIAVPGRPPRAWILAEADGLVVASADLPPGVVFHSPPSLAVLPPSELPRGPVRWLRAPVPARRWLPSAAAVLALLADNEANRAGPHPAA
ncbi:hypothetical protein ACFXPA_16690 [Amycolatopsis sp. NPDC059090]|uniref:hypothetical protein n=1 Tax=Amycolatopsis sp. NPDC059090 TaxID=3346723 RepID=UPI0036734EF8